MKLNVPDYIQAIAPYVPGKPIEELEREYGVRDSIKLASNENPLGPSPKALAAIGAHLSDLHRYPDGAGHDLTRKIAAFNGVSPDQVVIGNGSDDIIAMLVRALVLPGDRVVVPKPSFLMYGISAKVAGATVDAVPLEHLTMDLDAMAEAIQERTRLVVLCNPNNPTGTVVHRDAFERFMARVPEGVVVAVDEAYIEFARDPDCLKTGTPADLARPIVTLRTFSKVYGLAGLRVGYGLMPAELAQILHRVRQPFNVNSLAQTGAIAALDDQDFVRKTVDLMHTELDLLYAALDAMGLTYYQAEANFFLIDVKQPCKAVFEAMLRHGVIVRAMRSYGFPTCIRVTVGTPAENQRFLKALKAVLA